MREQLIQSKIMAVLNHRESPCRVWRNNVGMLRDSRNIPVRYGLAPGSADLVGVVMTTGQFLAVEVKTPIGRLSNEQKAWISTINKFGGLAVVMRTVEEAELLVARLRKRTPMCLTHDDCLDDQPTVGLACAMMRVASAGISLQIAAAARKQ